MMGRGCSEPDRKIPVKYKFINMNILFQSFDTKIYTHLILKTKSRKEILTARWIRIWASIDAILRSPIPVDANIFAFSFQYITFHASKCYWTPLLPMGSYSNVFCNYRAILSVGKTISVCNIERTNLATVQIAIACNKKWLVFCGSIKENTE